MESRCRPSRRHCVKPYWPRPPSVASRRRARARSSHAVGKGRLRAGGRQPHLGAPEREHPPPAARLPARLRKKRWVDGGEPLWRAQHETLVAQIERAPAPPGGEWHLPDDAALVDGRQPGVRDRLERRVARRGASGVACQLARERPLVHAVGRHQANQTQRRLGQRAGLVGADNVHRGERLDRIELLREHAALRHLEGGHRRGEADQQDQALGDEVYDSGGEGLHAGARGLDASEDRDGESDREREREREQPQQEPVVGRSSGERG